MEEKLAHMCLVLSPFIVWFLYEVYRNHQVKKDSARVAEYLYENYNLPTTMFKDIYWTDRGLSYETRKRIEEELFEIGFDYQFLHNCATRYGITHKSYSEWKRLGYIKI